MVARSDTDVQIFRYILEKVRETTALRGKKGKRGKRKTKTKERKREKREREKKEKKEKKRKREKEKERKGEREKRKEKKRKREKEKKRRREKRKVFPSKITKLKNPPHELSHHDSKIIPREGIIRHFSSKVQNLTFFFN